MPMKCERCGQALKEVLLSAMMQDLGARIHPDPTKCRAWYGDDYNEIDEHSFVEAEELPKEAKTKEVKP